jgi:hypothetical protein
MVRLEPAWRYVKIVPIVPKVRLPQNSTGKIENEKGNRKIDSYDEVENGCTNGTNGTKENIVCGRCAFFRSPKCPHDNWETWNGNESIVGRHCFRPIERDDSEDYPSLEARGPEEGA